MEDGGGDVEEGEESEGGGEEVEVVVVEQLVVEEEEEEGCFRPKIMRTMGRRKRGKERGGTFHHHIEPRGTGTSGGRGG